MIKSMLVGFCFIGEEGGGGGVDATLNDGCGI